MRLTVAYSGFEPLASNRLDFLIFVIDPCIAHAVLTPAVLPQTDPDVYWYTDASPAATFTMAPFTVSPAGFCSATHSCAVISGSRLDLCNLRTANSRGVFFTSSGNY